VRGALGVGSLVPMCQGGKDGHHIYQLDRLGEFRGRLLKMEAAARAPGERGGSYACRSYSRYKTGKD